MKKIIAKKKVAFFSNRLIQLLNEIISLQVQKTRKIN